MLTTQEEYLKNLILINDSNKPVIATLVPKNEKIYNIDLNTRTSEAPLSIGVEGDHNADSIYFKVDRFYDAYDLAHSACLIQYENNNLKDSSGYAYLVPFYDLETFKDENKIVFPWIISNSAAMVDGTLTFSFRFFELDGGDFEGNHKYIYSLNTKPATTKVLNGLNIIGKKDDTQIPIDPDKATEIANLIKQLRDEMGVYWIEV